MLTFILSVSLGLGLREGGNLQTCAVVTGVFKAMELLAPAVNHQV